MKQILTIFLMVTVSFFEAGLVNAEDLVAVWAVKDAPPMTMELKDQDNFRMNMGEDGYILMSQGKGYMVSKEKDEWVATSMKSMKKMMEMSGIRELMSQMGKGAVQDDRPPHFENTGRVETIAGIKGKIYMVSMENGMGESETVEIVFGDDPRLLRLHKAQARWTESSGMMGERGGPSFSELMKKYATNGPGGAMLRYADMMKLESVQEASLTHSRFKVPRVQEMDMSPIRDIGRQGQNNQERTQPLDTVDLEKEIERMQRQAEIEEANNEETEQDQENLIKGIDSMLKGLSGIFGN